MDMVAALVEAGTVTTDTMAALFEQAGGTIDKRDPMTSTLDYNGFVSLLDLLAPLAGDLESSVEGGGADGGGTDFADAMTAKAVRNTKHSMISPCPMSISSP